MAGTSLKIDDQYVEEMGYFIEKCANDLEDGMESYLQIMNKIKDEALMKGETAEALVAFNEYAEFLRGKIAALGETSKRVCDNFLTEVDEKDQFLF